MRISVNPGEKIVQQLLAKENIIVQSYSKKVLRIRISGKEFLL